MDDDRERRLRLLLLDESGTPRRRRRSTARYRNGRKAAVADAQRARKHRYSFEKRASPPAPSSHPFFWVHDADAVATRAGELGGSVLMPPSDTGVGRTVLADPAGAVFSVSKVV
jgi:predicted enzyme related to lactoylglutathione lyase